MDSGEGRARGVVRCGAPMVSMGLAPTWAQAVCLTCTPAFQPLSSPSLPLFRTCLPHWSHTFVMSHAATQPPESLHPLQDMPGVQQTRGTDQAQPLQWGTRKPKEIPVTGGGSSARDPCSYQMIIFMNTFRQREVS